MDNRFQQQPTVENGGMFTRERIAELTKYALPHCSKLMNLYNAKHDGKLDPTDIARMMIDSYRAANHHFIPTGHDLSTYARYAIAQEGSTTRRRRVGSRVRTSRRPPLVCFWATPAENPPIDPIKADMALTIKLPARGTETEDFACCRAGLWASSQRGSGCWECGSPIWCQALHTS